MVERNRLILFVFCAGLFLCGVCAERTNKNLCVYNPLSTDQFCNAHLNISRYDMPQLGDRFLDFLVEHPSLIKSRCAWTEPRAYTSTQREIHSTLTVRLMQSIINNNHCHINDPVFVSNDGYILDGHHRWSALTIMRCQMKTIIVDLPIHLLLIFACPFSETNLV